MKFIKNKTQFISQVLKYLTLFLISLLFMLIFSLWTTPLYTNWYGCDASFFTMAGRGITKGWVPYRDFFDLKGPYFFFLEALGQFIINGRSGAFVIQVFTNFFSLILIMKIGRLFISRKKTIFVMLVFLLGHISTLWGGNTLEEYALPLSLLCLYRLCKEYKTNNALVISNLTAFIWGLCVGVITFAKVTVCAPICAIIFATGVIYLFDRRFKQLIYIVLYVILGFLAGIAPIFIYFGIQGNLSDMIYCVFIFAFKRGIDSDKYGDPTWELKISGCYFAIVFAICQIIPTLQTLKNIIRKFAELIGKIGSNTSKPSTDIDKSQFDGATAEAEGSILDETATETEDSVLGETTTEAEGSILHKTATEAGNSVLNDTVTDAKVPSIDKDDDYTSITDVIQNVSNKKKVHFSLLFVLLCMSVLTSITLHMGDPFIYYFTTAYPSMLFALILMLYMFKPFTLFVNWRLDLPLACFVIFCVSYFASYSAGTVDTVLFDRDNIYYQEYADAAFEMGSLIPQADRDKVFSFNMDMQWFEINKILPCNRYQVNLQYFCTLDPRIRESLLYWLDTTPPKWLVIGGDLSTYIPEIHDSVSQKYTEIYANSYGALYLVNTETADNTIMFNESIVETY